MNEPVLSGNEGSRVGKITRQPVIRRIEIPKPDLSSKNLAIHAWKDKILETIKSNQVTVIEGSTGCGKTTQVPQFILDDALNAYPSRHCKIIVTQPRKIATTNVARRVAEERYVKIGTLVGYQVSLDKKCDKETLLTYMTTGTLLEYIINQKHLSDWTHIIVDEVHERDLDTDLLLCVLKKILYEFKDLRTRLILMSATVNSTKFLQNLKVLLRNDSGAFRNGDFSSCVVRITNETPYPITVQYLTDSKLVWSMDTPGIPDEIYGAAVNFIASLNELESSAPVAGNSKHRERGAVLVFLPGILEIENLHMALIHYVVSQTRDRDGVDTFLWEIIPLHSSVTFEEQQKAFKPATTGYRKIILATNIAESSITVTDIRYVVDFCLTKSVYCNSQTTFSCLRLEYSSQFQCVQRKGRVGRVAPGTVYRLVPQYFYDRFASEAVPEMKKSSLENVVLRTKVLDMGTPADLLSIALDPPKLTGIRRAVANLKEVGALSIYQKDKDVNNYTPLDGDLTYLGRIMARLPIDIRSSRLIAMGYIFGVLEETIIIAASMSTKSPFSNPYNRRLDAYLSKFTWAENSFSDCFALVNVFKTWVKKFEGRDFYRPDTHEKKWTSQFMLQRNVLREISILVQEIKRRLERMNIKITSEDPESTDRGFLLKIAIAGGFYPNYFKYPRPDKNEYHRRVAQEVDCRDPCSTVTFYGFPREQPIELYENHIVKHFEIGSSEGATIPYVEVKGPQLLLSFDNRGLKIGPVSHGVYRALKYGQMKQRFQFPVLSLLEDAAEALKKKREEMRTKNNKLKAPQPPPLPDIQVSSLVVHVRNIFSAVEFSVMKAEDLETSNRINEELENLDPAILEKTSWKECEKGDLVFVLVWENGIEKYARGRIELLDPDNNLVFVCLIDSGVRQSRAIDEIFTASGESVLFTEHAMAIECRLRGCRLPALIEEAGNEIVKLEIEKFVEEHNNELDFKIYSVLDGIMIGDLHSTIDVDDTAESLQKYLLRENLVEFVDEPVESIRNHNMRNSLLVQSEDPDQQQERLSNQISNRVPRPHVNPPDDMEISTMVQLKGPHNPLEMSFRTLCRSAFMKVVSVEGCSVNSVAIDSHYLEPVSRLLVAGTVTVADRTGNIVARETTLLPPIPNLTGLITMLFCPCMELRVDEGLTKYTGAIAGLGLNPNTGEVIYDDHDIEILFDTVIDNEDINLINSIRMTMNYILRQDNERELDNLRRRCQNELTELLKKTRNPIKESSPENPHSWDELPEYAKSLIPRNEKDDENAAACDVFELHHGISLISSDYDGYSTDFSNYD